MALPTVPTDKGYFDLFEELARTAYCAIQTFASADIDTSQKREQISHDERHGDETEWKIKQRQALDKKPALKGHTNIRGLARNLDNIPDRMKKAIILAERAHIDTTEFAKQTALIQQATATIVDTLPYFRQIRKRGSSDQKIREACDRISDIETEGDTLHDELLNDIEQRHLNTDGQREIRRLHQEEKMVDLLESTLNQCEDVAEFMRLLALENS